jgi:hypothetical protein
MSRKFGCDPADNPWLLTQAAALGAATSGTVR